MYFPKSHITPNLYSNEEFMYASSKKKYTGYYFSTINNRYFTGRYPNDGLNLELFKISESHPDKENDTISIDYRFVGDNYYYSKANKVPRKSQFQKSPTPFYPQPSSQDYKLGEFRRYFSKKSNEKIGRAHV